MPKGMPRDQSIERTILHRLKIARGHLEKVITMVEEGHYCIDVVHQSMAIQAALREADHLILKNHMETCVADSIRKGESREVIDEVMKIMEKKG
ncbi:MAG: metal-sensing transcriptional repressor [Patescibacteria group bacterium]